MTARTARVEIHVADLDEVKAAFARAAEVIAEQTSEINRLREESQRRPTPTQDDDLIGQAIRIVTEGRAYTRQNFPVGSPGKYVGHTPANEFDAAVDTVTAAAATLREENVLLSHALAASDEARHQAVTDCMRNVQALLEEQDARARAVAALAEEEAELERLGFVLRTEIGDLEREVERLRGILAFEESQRSQPPAIGTVSFHG